MCKGGKYLDIGACHSLLLDTYIFEFLQSQVVALNLESIVALFLGLHVAE